MPQQVVKNVGGTVETYILDRQVGSCTATVYDDNGAIKVGPSTASIDAVATTIAAPAAAGDRSVSLASAAGIAAGRRYLLDGQVPEVVTVKDLVSSTATLFGPLMFRHTAASTMKGTRVSIAILSTQVDTLFWDGYTRFTPNTGDPIEEVTEVVLRKIANPLIDETDLYDIFPKSAKMLDAELDITAAIKRARDNFIRDLGGKFRAHAMVGTEHMRRPCALRFWLDRQHSIGSDWAETMKGVETDYEHEIEKLQSTIPVDADQDGITTGPNDGGYSSIRLERM